MHESDTLVKLVTKQQTKEAWQLTGYYSRQHTEDEIITESRSIWNAVNIAALWTEVWVREVVKHQ